MISVKLPNEHGPGCRVELVDRQYAIDDGMGRELRADQLNKVGISRSQLDDVAHCMYDRLGQYKSFDLSVYDYLPAAGAPDDWYLRWAVRALDFGPEKWFASMQDLQPHSHALLTGPDSSLLSGYQRYFANGPPNPGHHVAAMTVLVVKDRVIELRPYVTPSPEEAGIAGFDNDAFPEVLLRTWWYRTAGYQIVRQVPMPIHEWAQPLLQYPGCGTGVNHLVAALGASAKRKYMPVLKEIFGAEAVTKVYQTGRVALLCILDTRPPETVATVSGDQLFVHMGRSDQIVYHVRACQFDQMRQLNPATLAECFDRYFAHVLSRTAGEFDFLPYTQSI